MRSGNEDIWKKPVDGGDPIQLTTDPATDLYAVWSPDGQRLSFSSDRGGSWNVWTISAEGGDPRQVTTDSDSVGQTGWQGMGTSWSPDGRSIAFSSTRGVGGEDIWIIPAGGGIARQLTHDPASDDWPAWSPDGQHIAFSSNRAGTQDIWVMPAAGGQARQVAGGPGMELLPGWSPDGAWLAYSSRPGQEQEDAQKTSLWMVPAQGGTPIQLTDPTTSGLAAFVPRWSPDGTRIAYNAALLAPSSLDLCVMDLSSGVSRVVADQAVGGFDAPGAWSPDGQWIAYVSRGPEGRDLWKIPAPGGESVQITRGGAVASGWVDVVWSPDGRRLAFTSMAEGHRAVSVVPSDGGAPRRITVGETDHIWMAWSPDGRRLAYSAQGPGEDWDLWVIPAAGGKSERVTSWPTVEASPTWSPDGEHLAFDSGPPGKGLDAFGVVRLPLAGGEPTYLADGWGPSWSPDGERILYSHDWDLWEVPAAGGTPAPVLVTTNVNEIWPRWSPDGTQILYNRMEGGGAPLEGNIWIADVRELLAR